MWIIIISTDLGYGYVTRKVDQVMIISIDLSGFRKISQLSAVKQKTNSTKYIFDITNIILNMEYAIKLTKTN